MLTHSPETASELLLFKMLIKELEDEECDPEFRRVAPRRGRRNEAHQGTKAGNTIIELTIKRTYQIKGVSDLSSPLGDRGFLPLYPAATISFDKIFYIA